MGGGGGEEGWEGVREGRGGGGMVLLGCVRLSAMYL